MSSMRTGADYRKSLRDGRRVWVLGEGWVDDVATHPATRAMVDEYVAWYDRHFDPAWQDTVLAPAYRNEHEDLSIIACGPMVPEAMRAAYILKQEFGYETRVLNIHTMKPIDREAIVRAAQETGVVVTAEEHQVGALAWRVSGLLTESPELYGTPVITGAIGVQDRFGDSGAPWELIKEFEVSAEHIAQKAAELIAIAKVKKEEEKLALAY